MTPKPEAHPDSVNGRLANYLARQKEAVLTECTEWLEQVRGDPEIIPKKT